MFKKSIIIIFCLLLSTSMVWADNGDGSGNGTGSGNGENSDIPLTLEKSSVEDGSTNVVLNPVIQLDFNKNICNITILPNNKKCFHLTNPNGDPVPIKLIFPDNQVQTEYKRQVFIIPQENLEADTLYRIAVDKNLQAKNGTVIDNAHIVEFTTGSTTSKQDNAILNALGDNIVTYETALAESADSAPVDKGSLDRQDSQGDGSIMTIAPFIAGGLILIIIIFTLVIIKRKRK